MKADVKLSPEDALIMEEALREFARNAVYVTNERNRATQMADDLVRFRTTEGGRR